MKLSDLKPSAKKTILIYGDSGVGKTILATSFPGPIFVADFDGKVSSAAAFHKAEQVAVIDYETFMPQSGNAADHPFVRYNTKLTELEKEAAAGTLAYKTIVLDSMTTYTEQMLKEIIRQNPAVKRFATNMVQVAAMQDYQIMNSHFKNMLVRLLQLPANIVVTAHIQTNKDEMTGEILREPSLPGKLPTFLPILFEEYYRGYVEEAGGKRRYMLQTQSDARFRARSQIRGLPATLDATEGYAALLRHMAT